MFRSLLADSNALWDCFLAVIPVVLAYIILWASNLPVRKSIHLVFISLLTIAWFVFLPNTCYLLTEWRHFLIELDRSNLFIAATKDKLILIRLCGLCLFYCLFSGFGLFTFTLAIRPIEKMLQAHRLPIWYWALPFFTSLSIGVYLGLVWRFNSWDIISRPDIVWSTISEIPRQSLVRIFVAGFALFLWLVYEAMDIWIDGLSERFSKITGRRIHLSPKTIEEKSINKPTHIQK